VNIPSDRFFTLGASAKRILKCLMYFTFSPPFEQELIKASSHCPETFDETIENKIRNITEINFCMHQK
jgi:hypothetical protein